MRKSKFMMTVVILMLITAIFVGCPGDGDNGDNGEAIPFSLQVVPQQIEDAITGQMCVLLVTVESSNEIEEVHISASAPNASVTVNPPAITPGRVAEVSVIASESAIGSTLTITIEGERNGLKETETASINIGQSISHLSDLTLKAIQVRDEFIPWLATNYPELNITAETEWTATIVRPHFMVVMYFLFFSDEWEMGVRWHVTIPPYDYGEIYLRSITEEVSPSYAFKISSLEEQEEPQVVEPEKSVWR